MYSTVDSLAESLLLRTNGTCTRTTGSVSVVVAMSTTREITEKIRSGIRSLSSSKVFSTGAVHAPGSVVLVLVQRTALSDFSLFDFWYLYRT